MSKAFRNKRMYHHKSAWKDLHGIGVIYCTIEKNGVVSKQSHYFIYSCVGLNAKQNLYYNFLNIGLKFIINSL